MVDVGLPKEMMFAHQIPGEALTGFTGGGQPLSQQCFADFD